MGGIVRGEIEFDTDSDEATELPLDFDPLGQSIEIFAGADLAFSIDALAPGASTADSCTPEDDLRPLAATRSGPPLRATHDCACATTAAPGSMSRSRTSLRATTR